MRKLGVLAIVAIAVVASGMDARADTILSGDSNVTNALVGRGTTVNAGNQAFFSNVLGAGTTVLIDDVSGYGSGQADDIQAYYSSLAGVSSSISGVITGASLSSVDLFVSVMPTTVYTAGEIAALSAFEAAGGTLFFLGDHTGGSFSTSQNANINSALAALGNGLSLLPGVLDGGYHTATGAQIAAHALTSGVTSFRYGATSAISVAGGDSLFFTTNGTTFVAVESGGAPVPEPATISLFCLAAGTFVSVRRRRRTA